MPLAAARINTSGRGKRESTHIPVLSSCPSRLIRRHKIGDILRDVTSREARGFCLCVCSGVSPTAPAVCAPQMYSAQIKRSFNLQLSPKCKVETRGILLRAPIGYQLKLCGNADGDDSADFFSGRRSNYIVHFEIRPSRFRKSPLPSVHLSASAERWEQTLENDPKNAPLSWH